ncbi:MAG: hypothetical protein AMXMBFR64_62930 [Myxococcales bacterium]
MSCTACGAQTLAEERFCPGCGYDIANDAEIQAIHEPALASARKWILGVGILYAISGVILALTGDQVDVTVLVGANLGLTAIHVGLWAWAKRAPFEAAVVALVLFVTLHLANMVADPHEIYRGIVIKALFLVALVRAVKAGLTVRRLRARRGG